MLGKEDAAADGDSSGGSKGPCPVPAPKKTFWRSASWSTSRSMLPPLNPDGDKDCLDPDGNNGGNRRRFHAPLTPRSQANSKARSLLPPLPLLAISRRSLDEWPKAGSDDVGEWPLPCTPGGRDLNNGGERLKLDLSSIQSNPDKNCGLVKREKIAFFDKECSKVADHIYLGGDVVARDRGILKQHGITHILNCVGFVCPEYFKEDFVYRTLWLQDSPSEDITSILYDVFDYFEDVKEQKGRVFVHCCQGVSRSTSLVIAYRMWREGESFDDAFQYVKAARGIADPNMGFACQLLQCQKRVHAFPLSPSSLLRMYRIASHSPYDPLHLVPKMLNSPSPAALDSRGAFIIHIPSAIYVWIGKKCEAIMERDARGAVCQIARYERLQGPIAAIKEGEEPSYFWDAFSNLLPLMDKSSNGVNVVESSMKIFPGEREVKSYNVDFEIFQKATAGGFVPPFALSDTEHETCLPARESNWSVLRRKFASGSMKEFASAPKLALSRVYPDSVIKPIASNLNSLSSPSSTPSPSSISSLSSSSSSSSSSSPPYLSPDSLTSESSISFKYFSDSPVVSPSTASCSRSVSSNIPAFSKLSLQSCILSPQSISKSADFIDVNFNARHCSQAASLLSKKSPLSIAERRGSMAKCLKLPMLIDDSREKDAPLSVAASEFEGVRIENNNCSSYEHNAEGFLEPKGGGGTIIEPMPRGTSGRVNIINSCKEAAFDMISDKPLGTEFLEGKCSTDFTGVMESDSACPKLNQLVICRWPSLEKIVTFGAGDLDSKDIFIFVAPSSGLCNIKDRVLYFWVGKYISHGKSNEVLGGTQEIGELEGINWNQVSSDVLTQMGLPDDTSFKIVKEGEESEEFLALLGSL